MNELAQSIYNDFQRRYLSDWWAQRVIQEGKAASMDDIAKLAHDLGYHLMAAVRWHIEDADLPSGEEMTALAHEILDPLLHDSYDMINAAADDLVKRLDAFRGVGISPRHADYPTERVDAICRSAGEEGKPRETITRRMSNVAETVVNSFSDRYMETNAALYSSAGFETYIERTDDGKCCPWCSKMAGRYEYPDKTPKDVFRRHDNCGCRVVWVSGNMRQDVHSKETWEQPNVTEPELVRNPDVTVPELTKNPDVKVPELTSGLLTEGVNSGIISSEPSLVIGMQHFAKKSEDFATVFLPKDEYAHVMSEIATNLTEEQSKRRVFKKLIGDYVYTVENNGFGNYRIIGKELIE